MLKGARIQEQRIGLNGKKPPEGAAAVRDAVEEMDAEDPVTAKLKADGDLATARAQLEQRRQSKADAVTLYDLGCALMAAKDWPRAMTALVEARGLAPGPELARKIQRQQRELCAFWIEGAKHDKAEEMSALGSAYEHGWGVGADVQEAKRWFRQAANAGDAEGMFRLASFYERRLGATVTTDEANAWYLRESQDWYRKAAALGHEGAKQWISTHDH